MRELYQYCKKITDEHLQVQPVDMLFCSTVEELGEVARAIKIENDGVGTKSKILDESARHECVDLFICGVAIWLSIDKGNDRAVFQRDDDADIFDLMANAAYAIGLMRSGRFGYILSSIAYKMFFVLDGTQEELEETMKAKLDKWKNNLESATS